MKIRRLHSIAKSLLALVMVLLSTDKFLQAETPESSVLRTFLLWMPPDATDADCPDLTDPDSLYLIARAGGQEQFVINFWDHESQPESLRGTRWVMDKTKLTHVANEETTSYLVSWQDDIAPSGARASTGEGEGAIIENTYRIRRVTTSEDSLVGANTWRVDNSDSGSSPICIGMGLFSK